MHEVNSFTSFAKGIFGGLIDAIKTDVDVFLITFAAAIWPFKFARGLFTSILFYVTMRRADGLMSAHLNIKKQELSKIDNVIQSQQ
jgi:hypothetical protein